MIYNNLIYLLVVVLVLTTHTVPEQPQIPFLYGFFIFLAKGALYSLLAYRSHNRLQVREPSYYFSLEQRLSIIAIICLIVDVYLLNCQYYFSKLPLADKLPVIAHLGGIGLFFGYLTIMWQASWRNYRAVFGSSLAVGSFITNNLKNNMPIIMPWLLLSLLLDLLQLSHIPLLNQLLASPWGESVILLIFFMALIIIFPLIVTRLWGCRPLPVGTIRDHIEKICQKQKLQYADIMIWPLFEGRVITAAVMGISKRFRYLLLTPALIDAMTSKEIDAVMAHEIGHVKYYHLQLYLLIFLGFGLLAQLSFYPIIYVLLSSDLFFQITLLTNKDPAAALTILSTISMLLLMIFYFRFVFGFFMRNFERQADLHAFAVMNGSDYLVQVFEKIAVLSGNIRDLPCWHHFGLGQRIAFLQKCQLDPSFVSKHHIKVYTALAFYILLMISSAIMLWKMPADYLYGAPQARFAEAVIMKKISDEPQNPLWHQFMGDLHLSKKSYKTAIASYEKSLAIAPDNAVALNNFAWLLLTTKDYTLFDPVRALYLAQQAARLRPSGYILDTLAHAYWANNLIKEAIAVQELAIKNDPANKEYYLEQMLKFHSPHRTPTGNNER